MSKNKYHILQEASKLFYQNGYSNTGIAEILEKSQITRPTLYYYFKSKSGLGKAYLDYQFDNFVKPLNVWSKTKKTLSAFLVSWAKMLKRRARAGDFFGCPFSAFSGQLNAEDQRKFQDKLAEIERGLRKILQEFCQRLYEAGSIKDYNEQQVTQEILISYEGCATLWRLSKDLAYFDRLKERFITLARSLEN